jgi:hypothetical protein
MNLELMQKEDVVLDTHIEKVVFRSRINSGVFLKLAAAAATGAIAD